jgi:hypothetical protein
MGQGDPRANIKAGLTSQCHQNKLKARHETSAPQVLASGHGRCGVASRLALRR